MQELEKILEEIENAAIRIVKQGGLKLTFVEGDRDGYRNNDQRTGER